MKIEITTDNYPFLRQWFDQQGVSTPIDRYEHDLPHDDQDEVWRLQMTPKTEDLEAVLAVGLLGGTSIEVLD